MYIFLGREALPGNPLNLLRARDRGLQLFPVNEEFPVSASHQLALITSLPFVHTARRYYRLNDRSEVFGPRYGGVRADLYRREDDRTRPFRGSKSRNKVSVGEPAEGSLTVTRTAKGGNWQRAPSPTLARLLPTHRALTNEGDGPAAALARSRVDSSSRRQRRVVARAPASASSRRPAEANPEPRVRRKRKSRPKARTRTRVVIYYTKYTR